MNITEFRQQYPQYESTSDTDLADALYNKFYSGSDKREFVSAFMPMPDAAFGEFTPAIKTTLDFDPSDVGRPAEVPDASLMGGEPEIGRGEDLAARVGRGFVGGAGGMVKGFSIVDDLRQRREKLDHPFSPQFTDPKEQAIDIRGFRALRGDKAQEELDSIRRIAQETAPGLAEIQDARVYKEGQKLVDWSNKTFETNPKYDELFLSKAAQGLGSMAVFMGTTLVSPFVGALAGAGMNADAQFADAIQSGASFEDAMHSANIGAAWGLTEVAPIEFAFSRLNKATGGWFSRNVTDRVKSKIAKVGIAGTVGAIGEAFQEGLMDFANNWTAKEIVGYDEERSLWQGVDESAEVGGVLGFLLTTITSAFGIKRRGRAQPGIALPEASLMGATEAPQIEYTEAPTGGALPTFDAGFNQAKKDIDAAGARAVVPAVKRVAEPIQPISPETAIPALVKPFVADTELPDAVLGQRARAEALIEEDVVQPPTEMPKVAPYKPDDIDSIQQHVRKLKQQVGRKLDIEIGMGAGVETIKIDTLKDDILTYLAKRGGLNRDDWISNGIDPEAVKDRRLESRIGAKTGMPFSKPLFRAKGGMTLDDVAEFLMEERDSKNGFAIPQEIYDEYGRVDANDALAFINDVINGNADGRYADAISLENQINEAENAIGEIERAKVEEDWQEVELSKEPLYAKEDYIPESDSETRALTDWMTQGLSAGVDVDSIAEKIDNKEITVAQGVQQLAAAMETVSEQDSERDIGARTETAQAEEAAEIPPSPLTEDVSKQQALADKAREKTEKRSGKPGIETVPVEAGKGELFAGERPADLFEEKQEAVVKLKPEKPLLSTLPMDEASRMARAKDMGFTRDVFHATTYDIDAFDMSKSNPESDWGVGIYSTTSEDDASINYSSLEGADLTNKIERRAEEIQSESEYGEGFYYQGDALKDLPDVAAKEIAEEELAGGKENIMQLKVKLDNPFRLGGEKPSFVESESEQEDPADFMDEARSTSSQSREDFDTEEEYDDAIKEEARDLAIEAGYENEPEGALPDFINSLRYSGHDVDGLIDRLADYVYDGGISAKDLDKIMRGTEMAKDDSLLWYAEDDQGRIINSEVYRQALQDAGFDGVIDATVYDKFGYGSKRPHAMEGIDQDTEHVVMFDPSQARKTEAAFDPAKKSSADLLASKTKATPSGLSVEKTQAIVDKTFNKPVADKIKVVGSIADLEKSELAEPLRTQTGDVIEGMYYPNIEGDPNADTIFLFADQFSNEDRVVWVGYHEALHRGMRVAYGSTITKALDEARTNKVVDRIANKVYQQRKLADDVKKGEYSEQIAQRIATDEALAELDAARQTENYENIQDRYQVKVPTGMKSAWRGALARYYEKVKRVLSKLLKRDVSGMSDADIYGIIRRSSEAAGGELVGAQAERAPPSTLPMDYESQAKRAKEQGFDTEFIWYHGTSGDIRAFDVEMMGKKTEAKSAKMGFFFVRDAGTASSYAERSDPYTDGSFKFIEKLNKATFGGYKKFNEGILKLLGLPSIIDPYGGNVLPVYLRTGKQFTHDYKGREYRDASYADVIAKAKESGHDSVLLENTLDGYTDEGHVITDITVIFDPKNIRSINAAFAPAESESARLLASEKPLLSTKPSHNPETAFDNWTLPSMTLKQALHNDELKFWKKLDEGTKKVRMDLRQQLQDRMIPVRRIIEAIESGGNAVSDFMQVYERESLIYGRVGDRFEQLERNTLEPMLKLAARNGITNSEIGNYLYALHAPSRNALISTRDPSNDSGSGMTNAEAAKIVKEIESGPQAKTYKKLAEYVRQITDATRKNYSDYQLLIPEVLADWGKKTNFNETYVPLKGWEESPEDEKFGSVGKGMDIRGTEVRRALGRTTRPADILSNITADYKASLIRGEKNSLGRGLYELAKANPNKDLWEVGTFKMRKDLDKKTGMVVERIDYGEVQNADEVFMLKIDGKAKWVRLKDKRLQKSMKNLGAEQLNGVTKVFAGLNRWLSIANTMYSPEFLVSNFFRDMQAAAVKLTADDLKDIRKKSINPKAIKNSIGAMYADLQGKSYKNKEWADMARDFKADGAHTDYFRQMSIEQYAKGMDNLLSLHKKGVLGKTRRGAKAIKELVENANGAVENAIRLSVYKNLREKGVSRQKAATAAKNLTVNFNRKGMSGATINALWLFYNASIQGVQLGASTLKSKKGRRAWYTLAIAGALSAIWNQLLGGEDDDGVPYIEKLAPYTRERNWVMMIPPQVVEKMKNSDMLSKVMDEGTDTGGRFIQIPAPYIFNIPMVLGDVLVNTTMFGEKVSSGAARAVLAINNSVNPVGDNSLIGSALPTVLDPVWQLSENKNFWGGNIHQSKWPGTGPEDPDFDKGFHGTNKIWKEMASWLNSATGGDKWRSGEADFHPETLRHWFQFITGGAGSFVNRVGENISAALYGADIPVISGDEPLKPEKTIFVRKVYGKVHPAADSNIYYDHRTEILTLEKEYKDRKTDAKLGGDSAFIFNEFRNDNREIMGSGTHEKIRNRCQFRGGGMIAKLKASDCKIAKLRKARKGLRNQMQTKSVKDSIRSTEDQILKIQSDFNKLYNDKYLDQGWLRELMETE